MFGKKKKGSGEDTSPWGGAGGASGGASGGDEFWGAPAGVPDAPPEAGGDRAGGGPQAAIDSLRPEKVGAPKSVPDLVEPVFLYLCKSHRLVREGQELQYPAVRRDVERLIEEIEKRAKLSPVIQQQLEKLREPLLWYFDYWLGSSGDFPTLQREWNRNRMGEEPEGQDDGGVLTGDEAFFSELDQTLKLDAQDELANDRLSFFYTAIGTGFCGPYFQASPEHEKIIRDYMGLIYPRIRQHIDANPGGRVTPECYKYTDKRDFIAPIRDRPLVLVCSILCLMMSVLMGYFWLYGRKKENLEATLNNILHTTKGDR